MDGNPVTRERTVQAGRAHLLDKGGKKLYCSNPEGESVSRFQITELDLGSKSRRWRSEMSCFPSAEVGWVPELWVQVSGPIQAGPLSTWPTGGSEPRELPTDGESQEGQNLDLETGIGVNSQCSTFKKKEKHFI